MLNPYYCKGKIEAGCDEAGRGCLAGPVFAAAVILPPKYKNSAIGDSKILTEKQREKLRKIIEQEALAWSVEKVEPLEIDKINILQASFRAMNLAVKNLNTTPDLLLIDGNRFKNETNIPFHCIVKGDATYLSIAAASILAKTYRDEYMQNIHVEFPQYNWKKNKGYPSKEHREAIKTHGATKYHRHSFRLLPTQLKIDF